MVGLCVSLSSGQVKLAQAGFSFLEVASDARATAMGEAVNSLPGYSGALFFNPATMAEISTPFNASFSVNSWIADIQHLTFSMIVSPFSGDYGVLGVSVQSVDYGKVLGTMVWNNDDGYINTGVMNPRALAVGIGYAKMISDRFGIGGQVKFAYQSLGKSDVLVGDTYQTKQNVANVAAFDFGTIFKTGIKSLAFGMSVRNFSREISYEEEEFQLPLLFTLGISANVFDFIELHGPDQSLILSLDASHPRSHAEQLKIGAEYRFMQLIALRGGYISNESEDGFSYGVGISSKGLGISSTNIEIDYSYTPFGVFDKVQRITARFSL